MGTTPNLVKFLTIFWLISPISADVFSCGGFVKSKTPVDYSKITVKLLTTEGHTKHEEEVNPSNGYFMIPVYNKGNYALKVSAPAGYYFEPDTFPLKLDGINDPCSKNEDIVFNLNGFSISGTVDGAAAGLSLVLSQNGQKIDSTVTKEGGVYEMRATTGKYEVSTGPGASECISRGKTGVEVSNAPVIVTPNLKISGYQLVVDVKTAKNKPFANANIEIFSKTKIDLPNIKCESAQNIEGVPSSHGFRCSFGKSDSEGKLVASCVPTGEYFIKASHSEQGGVQINFSPSVQKVTVAQAASQAKFTAESATSRVRVIAKEKAIPGVDVVYNSKNVGKTDSNGYVTLEGLKEGETHTVTASAENVHFTTVKINVAFPKFTIEDVRVNKFDICGTVEKSENGKIEKLSFTRKEDKKSMDVTPKADGTFCQSVSPGLFVVEPSDKTSALTPRSLEIDVSEKPVTNLRFTHFKTDAHVRVSCIGACPTSTVSLYLPGNTLVRTVKGTDVFLFENIGPGSYVAKLDDKGRGCWENSELALTVEQSKSQPTVHFVQNGFAAKLEISHPADIKWASIDKKQLRGETKAQGGELLSICVPTSGVYSVSLESCYKFEHQQFEMTVPFEGVRKEKAVAARISGTVDLDGDKSAGVVVKVKSSAGEREIAVSNADGKFVFDEPLSSSGETLHFIPTSSHRLFEPTSKSIKVSGKCTENAVGFKSFRGIFIDGTIRPAVEKVEIRAVLNSDKSVVIETISDKNGNYKIGPVKRVEDYTITAILDGYKFVPATKAGNFESIKLSQLSILVIDEESSEPLDGVLLSLVGGKGAGSGYRSNNVLDSTAQKNFVALAPGEYFVRAIMQEYKFSPSTTNIQVKEGKHESLVLKGKRVAFSAFGRIREMSGTPVRDVIVEALSVGSDSHQAEATTLEDGSFRLRGLLPNYKYNLYAKSYSDGSAAPHSFPGQFTIEMTAGDVKELDFIATTVDKTTDVAIEIDMASLREIQSVRVTVTRGHETVQTSSVQFPQHLFYISHLKRDGVEYSVRVEPEKPPQAFAAKTVFFSADVPIRVVRVPLSSSKKASDVDISFGSLMSLPFFVLLSFAFFNQNRVVEILKSLYKFATAPNPTGDGNGNSQRKRK